MVKNYMIKDMMEPTPKQDRVRRNAKNTRHFTVIERLKSGH
jgi:hypothetical protein